MSTQPGSFEVVALLPEGAIRDNVCKILSAQGLLVRCGSNATEVLDWLERSRPNLILIDCRLAAGALELLEALEADFDLGEVPVLFLTEAGKRPLDAFVKMTDRSAYLDRPFGPERLTQRVGSFLETLNRPDYESLRENRLVDSGSIAPGQASELIKSIRSSSGHYLLLLQSAQQTGVIELRDGRLTQARVGDHALDDETLYDELDRIDDGYYELLHQPNDWILQ